MNRFIFKYDGRDEDGKIYKFVYILGARNIEVMSWHEAIPSATAFLLWEIVHTKGSRLKRIKGIYKRLVHA